MAFQGKPAVHWTVRGQTTDSSKVSTLKPSLLIHHESLARRFVRKGVEPVPLVINHVVSSMIRDKDLLHLNEFQAMCEHVSFSRWLFRTAVVTPARWGLHSLHSLWSNDTSNSSSVSSTPIPPGPYVSMASLAAVSDAIVHFVTSELEPSERTFCLSQADHVACGPRLSCSFHALCLRVALFDSSAVASILQHVAPMEYDLIAKYLVWAKLAVVRGSFLKIDTPKHGRVVVVEEADESLLLLQHMIATLETSTTKLQAKMDETKAKAIAQKRAQKTSDAVVYLRHLKALGDTLAQRQTGLLNLLHTEHQLRDMHVQALVVEGYKVASRSLRSVRDSLGLTADAVDDAVADWQVVLDEATQVDALLSSSSLGVEFDDEALLAEFEALHEEPKAAPPARGQEEAEVPMPSKRAAATSNRDGHRDEVRALEGLVAQMTV
ncbi:hypothetical protein, variant 1 [Aphanomyces astaci]|uniref:Charged multivesicular body protein 7 n=1 Tax=Aphanomyces astaci TaxID=112090 RepID=W4H6W1_APHAT|nr:hypothetical protein, variant 1 [Aphanomyces astaci]ETV87765.1 hypothetical protein, variant 1 [Aphanomyces astaci]|eukprot:XP_009822628.1 hypothetical protein, variant 1 [Aphanomyces astaci]